MTLDLGKVNRTYLLERTELPGPVEKRLEALGMTRGTAIRVLGNKDRGTVIVKVRGTRLAMGKGISRQILTSSAIEEQ